MISTGVPKPATAADYLGAAFRYWLAVFPDVERARSRWLARADAIPEPELRRLALDSLLHKRMNVEGAAAYSAFAPRQYRKAVVRCQVAFQVAYDYLDSISERPSDEAVSASRQLHRALVVAVDGTARDEDYYAHSPWRDDGGYLEALVGELRQGLMGLPSYGTVLPSLRPIVERAVQYQALAVDPAWSLPGADDSLQRWAEANTPDAALRWWEVAAAAGSSLGALALIATAAEPSVPSRTAEQIGRLYWPWAGALHCLLDHAIDDREDSAKGDRNLVWNYVSPAQACRRIEWLAGEVLRRARESATPSRHLIVIAGMSGAYLASCPGEEGRGIAAAASHRLGALAQLSAWVMRARSLSARTGHPRRPRRAVAARREDGLPLPAARTGAAFALPIERARSNSRFPLER